MFQRRFCGEREGERGVGGYGCGFEELEVCLEDLREEGRGVGVLGVLLGLGGGEWRVVGVGVGYVLRWGDD